MRGARPGPQLLALLRPQSPMAAAALKVPPEVNVRPPVSHRRRPTR